MKYIRKITCRVSGQVDEIDLGDHITITELAIKLEVSRSVLVKVLLRLGLVVHEIDPYRRQGRYRLSHDAVANGMGFRLLSKDGLPFDVLAPKAVEWVAAELPVEIAHIGDEQRDRVEELKAAVDAYTSASGRHLAGEATVRLLRFYMPDLATDIVAAVSGVSPRFVRKVETRIREQLAFRSRMKTRELR